MKGQPMPHENPLPECIERYKRIDDKLTFLVECQKANNGKWQRHLEDSVNRIQMIERHDVLLSNFSSIKTWVMGIALSMVTSIIVFAVMWGGVNNQLETNTARWEKLMITDPKGIIK